MNSIYDSRQRLKYVFIIGAVVIAIASVFVSDLLIKDLAREERQKIEVWGGDPCRDQRRPEFEHEVDTPNHTRQHFHPGYALQRTGQRDEL